VDFLRRLPQDRIANLNDRSDHWLPSPTRLGECALRQRPIEAHRVGERGRALKATATSFWRGLFTVATRSTRPTPFCFACLPFYISRINLRPLQPAAIVHVHRLQLSKLADGAGAGFAVTVASRLYAAEGKLNLGTYRGRIYINDPGLEILNGMEGAIDVAGIHRGRSPNSTELATRTASS